LTLIQNAYGGAGGEAVFNPANVGATAAGGSASSILGIHDMAAANVSATAYANGGSGGSNENGSVAGAVASTTASTTLVGVGGAFGVSTAIGGGSVADGSGGGGGGATATTDVTAPGNATYSVVSPSPPQQAVPEAHRPTVRAARAAREPRRAQRPRSARRA
jgi:hypothetical protein